MTAVLTAVSPMLEAGVATRVEATAGARLARRCADVPDLLSASAAHIAQVAIISTDLPGLDRGVLGALAEDGLLVIGVFAPGDEAAQRRLRQLGVDRTIVATGGIDEWASVLRGTGAPDELPAAARDSDEVALRAADTADVDAAIADELLAPDREPASGAATARPEHPKTTEQEDDSQPPSGRIIAVWGPVGSPGRTTVAVNLAGELARLGRSVLLIDADTYGASVGQALALLDEAPGLAAATRLADTGDLDVPHLAAVAPEAIPGVRVLTGLPRADRWSEVRERSFREVLQQARLLVDCVVVDTGFCLEEDEELSYDTRAPRRNITTTTALREADEVIAVGTADPVGLQRLVRGLDELGRITADRRVVVTKVRAAAVGSGPERRVTETLQRFAGISEPVLVPDDRAALDAAMLAGRSLAEAAPGSPARRALAELAGDLAGVEVVLRRRGLVRRWRSTRAAAPPVAG